MSLDIALDPLTGDLKIAADNDVDVRTGVAALEQRMRNRLRMPLGSWENDPTGGQMGSRLYELSRGGVGVAIELAEVYVREALEPMADVSVQSVFAARNADNLNQVDITVGYTQVVFDGTNYSEQEFRTVSLTVG